MRNRGWRRRHTYHRLGSQRPFDARKLALRGLLTVAVIFIVIQLFYPTTMTVPFETVDGQAVGGRPKAELLSDLESKYQSSKVDIILGKQSSKVYVSPTVKDLGMKVSSVQQVAALDYPWYIRIVPTSIFWTHVTTNPPAADIASTKGLSAYIDSKLMSSCEDKPVNATLKSQAGKLEVVSDSPGGKCTREALTKELQSVTPSLTATPKAHVPLIVIPAKYQAAEAEKYRQQLAARIADNIKLQIKQEPIDIPAREFNSWLEFASSDQGVTATVKPEKAAEYLGKTIAPKVAIAPGQTQVTTRDFTEISRNEGPSGAELDVAATSGSLTDFINHKSDTPSAVTRPIPAKVVFTRTYSDSDGALSALLENYAKDHPGKFGISLAELSGKKRRANYNGDQQFVTASTYKLFVAYSTLRRVEAGTWRWSDVVAGLPADQCFDKMIVYSDNACAEAFLQKIGLKPQSEEMNSLGLKNSTFMKSGGPFTTANDLVTFLGSLESSQSLQGDSRSRLISAMSRNVYRKGIPAGASGTVADKVGFMDGLLHDAAIVYSPNGTYVLSIMTDGSSWATIADLTKQIETVRAQ